MDEKRDRLDVFVDQLRALLDSVDRAQTPQGKAVASTARMLSSDEMAELIVGARRVRNRQFGGSLFGEPAWDIMLELYIAHYRDHSISVTAATTFGDTPSTTGLRWLSTLEAAKMVSRATDPYDGRRQFVRLSDDGIEAMDAYMAAFAKWTSTRATMRKA